MSDLSTFLFARSSFAEGVARLVDFGGTLNEYNYSPTGRQADMFAHWADWTAIGNDMRTAWAQHLVEARDVEKLAKANTAS